jgi:peptidoglycan/xylan/chitin deacetylase (PgdA/CDA1 family)
VTLSGGLASLAATLGVTRLVPDRLPTVINYHSVGVPGGCDNISTAEFRRHVEWLDQRYDIVDLPDVFDSGSPRENAVALTFDDGLESFHRNARPVLAERSVPATVFALGAAVGRPGTTIGSETRVVVRDRLATPDPLMSTAQLQTLAESPLFTVGSHSMTHPRLTELTADQDRRCEVVESRECLESALGVTVDRFAYPYHQYDERVLELVRDTYDYAGRNSGRAALITETTDPHLIPRLAGGVDCARLQLLVTDTSRRFVRWRRGRPKQVNEP